MLCLFTASAISANPLGHDLFQQATAAYESGDFTQSASLFHECAALQPASGTLQNVGNAEWQNARVGPAILAWEQSLWLDSFNEPARLNLRFARKSAQLEPPDLAWFEVVSTWLHVNYWAWLTGVSLWVAIGMITLPGILRLRKAAWHQAIAAVGLMVFLLTLPAHLGVHGRSRIGFVLQPETPLRLTPTMESQVLTRLPAGQPARVEQVRGNYVLARAGTLGHRGWIERERFALVCAGRL